MDNSAKDINELINDGYVPTSIERKKAVLMYFLLGILMALAKPELSKYERYHLKQAIGFWCIFFMGFCLIVFSFLPFLRVVPVLVYTILIFIWIYFFNQAWKGYYVVDGNKIVLPFFAGLGGWVLDVFEVDVGIDEVDDELLDTSERYDLDEGILQDQKKDPDESSY